MAGWSRRYELTVDNVALTGESAPAHRTPKAVAPGTAVTATNLVFMGTSVVKGTATAVAFATGSATQFGRMYQITTQVTDVASPLQVKVNRMAKQVSLVAVALAAVVFGLRAVTTSARLVDNFVFALGVHGGSGPRTSSRHPVGVAGDRGAAHAARHALIKRLAAVETLGSTTVICTDKTGTLTEAEMTISALWESGRRHTVSSVGYAPKGDKTDPASVTDLLRVAAQCCDAQLLEPDTARRLDWWIPGDTTEGATIVAAAKVGIDVAAANVAQPRVGESHSTPTATYDHPASHPDRSGQLRQRIPPAAPGSPQPRDLGRHRDSPR